MATRKTRERTAPREVVWRLRINSPFVTNFVFPISAVNLSAYAGGGAPDRIVFVCADGEEVDVRCLCTWNNADGRYDHEIDKVCRRMYGRTFDHIKSVWRTRVSELGNYWCWAQMARPR